jgi:hypothetical protein
LRRNNPGHTPGAFNRVYIDFTTTHVKSGKDMGGEVFNLWLHFFKFEVLLAWASRFLEL